MYLETMDTETTKFPKPEYLRHGFNATWMPFCDPKATKWAFQENRNIAAVRKHPSGEQRLAQRGKLCPFVKESKKKKKTVGSMSGELVAAACLYSPPAGGMAPRNTTQFLMSNVYEDMKMDSMTQSAPREFTGHVYSEDLSPCGVSAALDSCFEDILEYQLRDFDELYDLTWKPE